MKIRFAVVLFSLASLVCSQTLASSTPPMVHGEIVALLDALKVSGCKFERNGQWYSSAEARDHIFKKLEYLEGKGSIESSESFIELAASKSSVSGKPYHVKCGSAEATESQQWLRAQLLSLRSGSRQKP